MKRFILIVTLIVVALAPATANMRAPTGDPFAGMPGRELDDAELEAASGEVFNRALTLIEEAQAPPPAAPDDPAPFKPPAPVVKKRRLVDAGALWGAPFIETEAEMEKFLTKLRGELEDALKADERIQIK